MTVLEKEKSDLCVICKRLRISSDGFVRIPGRGCMWVGTVLIEPSLALYWLEKFNTKNRKRKTVSIRKYAEDMKDGQWKDRTHEALAFGWKSDLKLWDGQNRLKAVVDSGKSVRFLVYFGIRSSDAAAIDTGSSRTPADAALFLDIGGVTGANVSAVRGAVCGVDHYPITNLKLLEYYEEYAEGLLFLAENLTTLRRVTTLAKVRSALLRAHAWYSSNENVSQRKRDLDRLSLFCVILSKGNYTEDGDRAAFVLRDRLLTMDKNIYGLPGRAMIYLLTEAAIVKFMDHFPLRKLWRAREEQFPFAD